MPVSCPLAKPAFWLLRPPWTTYRGGGRGEFKADAAGRVSLRFPLRAGPGYFFVVCHLRSSGSEGGGFPATAAMITAAP